MAGLREEDHERARLFRALALPCLDDVYSLARYLLGNATDAEDATQECYLRAFQHFATYRGPEIKPWLFAILRNVCHSQRARQSRVVPMADPAGTDGYDEAPPMWSDGQETPEHQVLRERDAQAVQQMVGDLPAVFRKAIVLRDIDGLSYRQIADIVGAPIGTIMSRLARARALLRAAWTAADDKESRT